MGMYSCIQQNSVLGSFSMTGMGNAVSHNVFPFYIYLNGKYLRFNKVKIPEELQIDTYSSELINLIENLKKNDCDKKLVKQYDLPENIKYYIYKFLDVIKINKI
jgi:acyl-[acyl carrier protein]--UDP-N-acetylglucosamine O-acyltransferase